MSSLLLINSFYILKYIYEFTGDKRKMNLIKHSKIFQKKFDLNLFSYKIAFFTKNIPEITKSNLLYYYEYLKRKYLGNYSIEDLKQYFIEYFCKFIDGNNIIYTLDASHELARDILLCDKLKRISLILNLNHYKSSYITEKNCDKNKKPFIPLFQAIFDVKTISKISEIIITSNNEKDDYIIIDNDFLFNTLARNIYKFKPKIKTNIKTINDKIMNYMTTLKKIDFRYYDILKSWKVTVPYPDNSMYSPGYVDNFIQYDVDLNSPFGSRHLDFIKKNKINNYFIKLNYEDLWFFNDDFSNIKKLELKMKNEVVSDIRNFKKVNEMLIKIEKDEDTNTGEEINDEGEERIKKLKKNFNYNNIKYISYINK